MTILASTRLASKMPRECSEMFRLSLNNEKAQVMFGFVVAMIATPMLAEQPSIIDAFYEANTPLKNPDFGLEFELRGCVFRETILRPNYCERTGKGEGDGSITTTVDLSEVQSVRASWHEGRFHIYFDLDYGGPGPIFVLSDRVLNGTQGAFERFSKRNKTALENASLQSGKLYSRCDSGPASLQKSASVAFISNTEPEGWRQLIELARECRKPNTVELKEP
ncbi:hypothetical protein P5P81_21205 [Tritonibacter mobilis]|nr:hypothetical protein [Tritonibacter mobilis]